MGSAPRWVRALVTALAAAAVFVGTFFEFYSRESDGQWSPDYIHDRFAGLTGLTLGYLAGLLLVALVWPAPRRKGAVPAPGKDRPTGSFGQRLFALEVWGLFGVSFLPSALTLAAGAFEPINTRLWPPPIPRTGISPEQRDWDLPESPDRRRWLDWEEESEIRTRRGAAAGASAAGAVLVLLASWLGPRPLIRRRSAVVPGLDDDGFEPAASGPHWGPVSFAVGLATHGMAFIWILSGYNPVGRGVPNSFGRIVLGYAIVAASLFGIGAAVAANRRKERWYPVTYLGLLLSGWFLYFYLPVTSEGVESRMQLFGDFVSQIFAL